MSLNESQIDTEKDLQIDKILSTQPELGPSIPDGGYGWVIVIACAFFKVLIPTLPAGFGIFSLFWKIENNASLTDATMWDSKIVYVAFFFTATWTIIDPQSRKLCTESSWPRIVATSGTCLSCAGLLFVWIGINAGNSIPIFLLAGATAGVGSAIVIAQSDILLSQYFSVKLETVNLLLNAATAMGFIIVPVALGHNIIIVGTMHVIIWYQAIILEGILFSIVFRKPQYLKNQRTRYKLVRGLSDDEEDVFAKTTELQNPHSVKTEVTIEEPTSSNNNNQPSNIDKSTWIKFDEDASQVQTVKTHINLHKTFASDFNDLDKIEHSEENTADIPSPLFSENYINNNTSYSYETPAEVDNPVVFVPTTASSKNWRDNFEIFKEPTFYKSLLFVITSKYSIFIFWTLFPAHLYVKVDYLNVYQVPIIIGCVGIGSLLFTALTTWIKSNSNTRAIFLWIFCWIGTIGYLVLSDSRNQTGLIFGAMAVTLSISALQILGIPLLKIGHRGENTKTYTILCTLTGLSFVIFLIFDMQYKTAFRLMGMLHFITGSLWCTNYIYKRIKHITRH